MATPNRTHALPATVGDLLRLRTIGWREALEAREASILAVLVVMGIALGITYPQFGTLDNVDNILLAVAQVAIVGVGMTMVIITGGIDVSVGSALSVCAVVVAMRIQDGAGIPEALVVGIAVGAGIGLVNGLLIGLGRVHSIIITFGMLNLLRVVSFKLTGGKWLTGLPDTLNYFGSGTLLKLPFAWWIAMAMAAVATYYLRRRPTGRHLYALGGNAETARLAGVAVLKRTIFVYTITGALVGVASLVFVGQAGQVVQTNVGYGFELDVIAAVVIGGTSILGGKGTVIGTLLGALLVGTIRNAFVIVDVNPLWADFILGALILLTTALDLLRRRGRET